MSTKFSSTAIGLGENNEVIASSCFYCKERQKYGLINYSFSTNLFTYLDAIEENYKNELKQTYLQYLEKEKLKERTEFFVNEFESMKKIRNIGDITRFEEGTIPGGSNECFYFKANGLNEKTTVMIIPETGDASISNECYPEIEFIFLIQRALTEEEFETIFPAITYTSKNRIRLLFELRSHKNI